MQSGNVDICAGPLPNRAIPFRSQSRNHRFELCAINLFKLRAGVTKAGEKIVNLWLILFAREIERPTIAQESMLFQILA